MKIVYTEYFTCRLEDQIRFISKDSRIAAIKFKNNLIKKIKDIPQNPFLHRKSIYFHDNSIRDLIFNGYTIVYKIHDSKQQIEVFGFVKYQEKL